MQLEKAIEKIKEKARADDPMAVREAVELTETHPGEAATWSLLSYVHARIGNYQDAIADLTQAIEISSNEPVMYFNRGRYRSILARHNDAIGDYTRGIALCEESGDDYYLETLYFLRAHAYLKLGNKGAALLDLSQVKDEDFSFWEKEIFTKKQLLSLCNSA